MSRAETLAYDLEAEVITHEVADKAAAELRRLAQVEADHAALLKAISDAEPVAWISEVQCIGPEYGKKRHEAVPIQSLNPLHYKHTPLYTLNGIKKP